MRRFIPCLLALACASPLSYAATPSQQGAPAPGQQMHKRVPPPEAFEACDGKKAGDTVTFTTPRGEKLKGTCKMFPARLVATPAQPPQGGMGQDAPPPPPPAQ
jgi:hypothetical protein